MEVSICGNRASAHGLNIVWLNSGKKWWSGLTEQMGNFMAQVTRWLNRRFVWLTVSEHVCAFCEWVLLICAYQWVPGLHEQLCRAVSDAVRDSSHSVHGADCAYLPGLLGCLHKLHCHPEFSEVLHPCTGRSTLLPQSKMAIMAHR